MKTKRHADIIEIIRESPVATQEDLLLKLSERGYNVTQATVSRDIKELRLIKMQDARGNTHYSLPVNATSAEQNEKFRTIFRESVIHVASAGNIVVIKCYNGMANAAAAAIDSMELKHVVGTIAGDDTIFAAVDTARDAEELMSLLNNLL